MCILVVTASFTSGLTDILFNKMLVYMTGHIARGQETQYTTPPQRRDPGHAALHQAIKENVDGDQCASTRTSSAFGRTVGNGKTGMVALVGIAEGLGFLQGDRSWSPATPGTSTSRTCFPGIIMYKNAARDLNVSLNDIVTVRFQTVYGQARRRSSRSWGSSPPRTCSWTWPRSWTWRCCAAMLNLKPEEVLGLNIVTEYPENSQKVIAMANRLHDALAPQAAGVKADLAARGPPRAKRERVRPGAEQQPGGARDRRAEPALPVGQPQRPGRGPKDGIVLTAATWPATLGAAVGTKLHYRYVPSSPPGSGAAGARGDGHRGAGSRLRREHGLRQRGAVLRDLLLEHAPGAGGRPPATPAVPGAAAGVGPAGAQPEHGRPPRRRCAAEPRVLEGGPGGRADHVRDRQRSSSTCSAA